MGRRNTFYRPKKRYLQPQPLVPPYTPERLHSIDSFHEPQNDIPPLATCKDDGPIFFAHNWEDVYREQDLHQLQVVRLRTHQQSGKRHQTQRVRERQKYSTSTTRNKHSISESNVHTGLLNRKQGLRTSGRGCWRLPSILRRCISPK